MEQRRLSCTALGHCGECHTPRNFGFGLEHGHELAGEELQGWRAYNITPDAKHGIGAWSDADIAGYLTTGHAARACLRIGSHGRGGGAQPAISEPGRCRRARRVPADRAGA